MAHNELRQAFAYAPSEFGVIGRTQTEVAEFSAELVETLAKSRRVVLVSSDGPGESELPAAEPPVLGIPAATFYSQGPAGYSVVGGEDLDPWTGLDLWGEAEIVIVEAADDHRIAKLALVDPTGSLLDEIAAGQVSGIQALVLPSGTSPTLRSRVTEAAGGLPILDRHDVQAAAAFVEAFLIRRACEVPLFGLVLGGGKSARMRRDKSGIDYHGLPQVRFAYELLGGLCERVFISNRAEQAADPVFSGLQQIHDRFIGFGPMGGILSAMHTHPAAAWVVLGCDLPFVDRPLLEELLELRDPLSLATCYDSSHDGLPEPLCAVYEPRYRRRLHQFLASGRDCPRKALINSRVKRLKLSSPEALDNVNSPEEYGEAVSRIAEGVRSER
ncbi:MAG TPA: NTP transferase domain-containing protein [Spirochaetia bacterium]|nr:NTP transferase domain-containing protein [Spirochaetia bacterium]